MGGVEYQVTKVDPTDPQTKGAVYQVHSVSEEIAATLGGKVYRARIIKDPTAPTVAGKVYQIVLIGDPSDPAVKGKVYNAILTGDSEAVVIGPAVPPLSLPDAIANSLSYVKAFGGTKQQNLPDGYTELEYIQSSGTQYIDTGITPTNSTTSVKAQIKSAYISTQTTDNKNPFIFGAAINNAGVNVYIRTGLYTSLFCYTYTNGNTATDQSLNVAPTLNSIYDTELEYIAGTSASLKVTQNGTSVVNDTKTGSIVLPSKSLYLFAYNGNNNERREMVGKIYSAQIYMNNILVRNFIPAKRNSDNVVGMYDTVSQTFFTNAGTGDFIGGAPVDPVLPSNYIRRDFIYMIDGSYLLTDVVPTYDSKVEMDFQTTSVPSQGGSFLAGRSAGYPEGLLFGFNANKTLSLDAFGGARYTTSETISNNTRYKYVFDNKVGTVYQGSTVFATNTFTGTNATGAALCINGNNNNGTIIGNVAGIYLYSFKAWNAQGELVANYVPAIQKGTVPVVGFYDTVSGTFKTATAGTFAAGPEHIYNVTPTPDNPIDIISNNGALKVSKNLFDETYADPVAAIKYKAIYVGDGTFTCSYSMPHNDINSSMVYFLAGNVSSGALNGTNQVDATYPRTVAAVNGYVTIGYRDGTNIGMSDAVPSDYHAQIEQGSTVTPYHPYGIYADGTVETINVHGKNLFDSTSIITGYRLSNLLGNTYGVADFAANTNYYVSNLIPVEVGKTYIKNSPLADVYHRFKIYNANKVSVRISSENSITIQNGEAYIAFCGLQTELATAYCGELLGTATAEMLLKVGDYQDVQSILDGAVTRNIGVKVLDGTENWIMIDTAYADGTHRIYTTDFGYSELTNGISTHFVGAPLADRDLPTGQQGKMYHSATSFHLRATQFTSLPAAKQWLADQYAAGHPVIIIYPLATPTTESVAGQTLQVQAGDNTLEITQASLSGLELEAEYEKEGA